MIKYTKKNPKMSEKVKEVVDTFTGAEQLKTDPLGSWTGNPKDKEDVPVQDADDL